MNSIFKLLIDSIFVFSVILIWIMLIYQFILTLGGFLLRKKNKKKDNQKIKKFIFPGVSILIPARNEEMVIARLLEKIQGFDYPMDKLEIIVINDGSEDKTATIVSIMATQDKRIKLINIPGTRSGKGKARALNLGLKYALNEVIAVYDADNLPEKSSLKKLCEALVSNQRLAAVTGKFRAYNKNKNLLTRFINIESVAFQWIIQAGRWFFLKISFLPGTNFIIWKTAIEEVGGWNDEALTEDTELTLRLYQKGYLVKYLPTATTWEQEPETINIWLKQRTRWARGNIYILSTYGKRVFRERPNIMAVEIMNLFFLYYLFIFAILASDILFVLSLLKLVHIRVLGPYTVLWSLAFLLYLLEIFIALSFEKEDTPLAVLWITLAYLTYTKLWIFVVLRSLYQETILKKERIWIKTERFSMEHIESNIKIQ